MSRLERQGDEPPFLVSASGLHSWSAPRANAWVGLLHTHAQLTKALDADLIAHHHITLSAYELLARLAVAEEGHLRMSRLAELALLSQSRVSRIVDQLEERGLVERRACPGDSRVVHAAITERGSQLLCEAQATHFRGVQERFFGRLDCDDVEHLVRIWAKVTGEHERG
jgi:DNA-binding MarR family transcriptional regulator